MLIRSIPSYYLTVVPALKLPEFLEAYKVMLISGTSSYLGYSAQM